MQAILRQIATHNISEVRDALEQNFANLSNIADAVERRLYATLKFIQQSLPGELTRLLIPLALHERFLDTAYLEAMAARADKSANREHIERFTATLVRAGLLTDVGSCIYEIHALLPSFLRVEVLPLVAPADAEKWTRAFVDVMAGLACEAAPKELHEQRPRLAIHQANFNAALSHARKLQDKQALFELSQSLGCYAYNLRNFARAKQLFACLVDGSFGEVPEFLKARSYHLLARIARETGDCVAAKNCYHKIQELKAKANDEQLVGIYLSLGALAAEQREFTEATNCYLQLLQESKRIEDQRLESWVYRELGEIAAEQGDFTRAKEWHGKSLQLGERLGDYDIVADTCYASGIIAQLQGDVASANTWLVKALEIAERLGNEKCAARTAHELGNLAQRQHDLTGAENWFRKSLELNERLGDEESAAQTYYELGRVACMKSDIQAAEEHFLRSLRVTERTGDEYNTARNYGELAAVAKDLGDFATAEKWCVKGLSISQRLRYESLDMGFYQLLGTLAFHRGDHETAEQWHLRALEVTKRLGKEDWAAGCYHDLAMNAFLGKGDSAEAEDWYLKSARIFKRRRDAHGAATAYMFLGISLAHRGKFFQGGRCLSKAFAGFLKTKDTAQAQLVARNFLTLLSKAPGPVRTKLRAMWKKARLGPSTTIG